MSAKQRLYYALPVPAQNVLVSAYGYYLRHKRGGSDLRTIRDLIAQSRSWTRDQIAEHQRAELSRILRLCAGSVPYYRDRWTRENIHVQTIRGPEDLSGVPILEKETVRTRGSALRRPGSSSYWTQHTSGSTGTPVVVHVNQRTYKLVHALLEAHEEKCGIDRHDLRATFAGRMVQPPDRQTLPFWRYNRAQRQILFSAYHLSARTLPLYFQELVRCRPAELIGYPSAISTVAGYINSAGLQGNVKPRVVITNSETLFTWQRDAIEQAFGCPVRDYYGSAEAVVFAAQCAEGAYHFDPLLGIAEIVDSSGRPVAPGAGGRLICTTLTNDTMPLVRYEIGDAAVRLEGPCRCGLDWDGAREIIGRQDDVLTTSDGRSIGRIDHIFKGLSGIREGQVVQEALDSIRVVIVPDSTFDASQERALLQNVQSRLGDSIRVEISRVTEIPRTPAGKFRGVLNRVDRRSLG